MGKLILSLVLLSVSITCNASLLLKGHDIEVLCMGESGNKIDLSGTMTSTGTRSLHSPIIVTQYDDYLEVFFINNNPEDISIHISDNMNNHLYQNTANGTQQKILIISVPNFENGRYEIKFTNPQGEFLKGQFVIQR